MNEPFSCERSVPSGDDHPLSFPVAVMVVQNDPNARFLELMGQGTV